MHLCTRAHAPKRPTISTSSYSEIGVCGRTAADVCAEDVTGALCTPFLDLSAGTFAVVFAVCGPDLSAFSPLLVVTAGGIDIGDWAIPSAVRIESRGTSPVYSGACSSRSV